jgi:hypothetical protein
MLRASFALLALAASLLVAGCGEKEEPDLSEIGTATASGGALEITASGGTTDVAFQVAGELQAGVTEIKLRNNAGRSTDAQLVRVDGDHEPAEVLAELRHAVSGEAVDDWFHAAGGPGQTPSGGSSTVTQALEPGAYFVVPDPQVAPESVATFEITGDGGGELPRAQGEVAATEYAFSGRAGAGPSTLLLANKGDEWHHFRAAQLKPGVTIADVKSFLRDEKGPLPFVPQNGIQSTVMDGGTAQVVDADLPAGRYAFYCLVSDRGGGPPHATEGMVSEIAAQ